MKEEKIKRIVAVLNATSDAYGATMSEFMKVRKVVADYLRYAGLTEEAEKLYDETLVIDAVITSSPYTLTEEETKTLKTVLEWFEEGEFWEYKEGSVLHCIKRKLSELTEG